MKNSKVHEPRVKPPNDAKRIYTWSGLPNTTEAQSYLIENEAAEVFTITSSKAQHQMLEGLMTRPIHAASYCQISDQVNLLREAGLDIETEMFRNDPETGRNRYRVYFLKSRVTPIIRTAEAA